MLREVNHTARPSLAGALLGALALHAALWLWLQPARPPLLASAGPAALQTRSLPAPAPPPTEQQPPPPLPRRAEQPRAMAEPAPLPGKPDTPAEALPAPSALPVRGQGSLGYRYTQGQAEGQARLSWDVGANDYQLRLEREVAGRALPGWRSEGRLDAQQGLAPGRFAVQRGGRDRQAINFRREQGLISFSASAELQAMPEGVQDRLSWWLQLPALLAAQPKRLVVGQDLVLPVAAMRGTAVDWVFRVEGQDEQGRWHLSRGALGPYDARLDIWLDPRRHYLPVRVRQSVGDEERWEMQLADEPDADDSPNR